MPSSRWSRTSKSKLGGSPTSRSVTASSSPPSGASGCGRLGSVAASASRRSSTSASSACISLSSAETRLHPLDHLGGVLAGALRGRDLVGGLRSGARGAPRPRAAARGGGRRARAARRAPRRRRGAPAPPGPAPGRRESRAGRARALSLGRRRRRRRSGPGVGVTGRSTSVPAYSATNSATACGLVADDDVLGHDRAREAAVADRVEDVLGRLDPLVEVRPLVAQRAVRRALGAGRLQRVTARAALGEQHGALVGRDRPRRPGSPRCRRRPAPAPPRLLLSGARTCARPAASYFSATDARADPRRVPPRDGAAADRGDDRHRHGTGRARRGDGERGRLAVARPAADARLPRPRLADAEHGPRGRRLRGQRARRRTRRRSRAASPPRHRTPRSSATSRTPSARACR